MVEQAAGKAIYLGGAHDQLNNKIEKFAKSRDCPQHVIHELMQSPTFTAMVISLVR